MGDAITPFGAVAQRDSLRKMECDYVQGYFYYRPMDVSAFEEILTNESIIEPDYMEGLRAPHTSVS